MLPRLLLHHRTRALLSPLRVRTQLPRVRGIHLSAIGWIGYPQSAYQQPDLYVEQDDDNANAKEKIEKDDDKKEDLKGNGRDKTADKVHANANADDSADKKEQKER